MKNMGIFKAFFVFIFFREQFPLLWLCQTVY